MIDDSDHQRSKSTTHIAHVHRIKDKKTDGYFRGQNLVFLLLVTDRITLPVGFAFYEPDPAVSSLFADDQPEQEFEKIKDCLIKAISFGKACSTKHLSNKGFQNILPSAA